MTSPLKACRQRPASLIPYQPTPKQTLYAPCQRPDHRAKHPLNQILSRISPLLQHRFPTPKAERQQPLYGILRTNGKAAPQPPQSSETEGRSSDSAEEELLGSSSSETVPSGLNEPLVADLIYNCTYVRGP